MVRAGSVIIAILLVIAPAPAADKPAPASRPAHQHGAASLHVSLDGGDIALEGPADNLLGFEHAPRNEAQRKTVERAEQQLKQPVQLFATPPAAECQVQPARVDVKLPAAGSREVHSEIEAEWRWACGKPDALAHVDVGGLFKAFPRLKQLTVQIVSAQGQKATTLRPGTTRVKISS
jgi:Protein of unknown function (DUF2796)